MIAREGSTCGLKPEMAPSSLENRTDAAALRLPSWIVKSFVSLETWPFGLEAVPVGLPAEGGIASGAPSGVPSAANTAALPVPLLDTRNCPPAVSVKPQG